MRQVLRSNLAAVRRRTLSLDMVLVRLDPLKRTNSSENAESVGVVRIMVYPDLLVQRFPSRRDARTDRSRARSQEGSSPCLLLGRQDSENKHAGLSRLIGWEHAIELEFAGYDRCLD